MQIGKVCETCHVTRKAVEYYEQQGLIHPTVLENGYRDYGDKDILMLKEISMLRKLDISIADSKAILFSVDKRKALADYQIKMKFLLDRTTLRYDCLTHLISSGYDVEETTKLMEKLLDESTTIQDKLCNAFPGSYGKFLNIHFGRFLKRKVDTTEKVVAYQKIVDWLDDIRGFNFSSRLEEFFELYNENFDEQVFEKADDAVSAATEDYSGYLEKNKSVMEQYLEIRNSAEYKASPAFEMQKAMLEFQRSSGYRDVFIANLKILSKPYAEYMQKLQTANLEFLKQFPSAKDVYKE